jgi:SNF2 family DNA or RNA helicase
MEPVWQKDEEAQAVKRAHRLGQTRPVHVETLIMKGSFEERVFKRGSQLNRRGERL